MSVWTSRNFVANIAFSLACHPLFPSDMDDQSGANGAEKFGLDQSREKQRT
jgi:hypothetical protein